MTIVPGAVWFVGVDDPDFTVEVLDDYLKRVIVIQEDAQPQVGG